MHACTPNHDKHTGISMLRLVACGQKMSLVYPAYPITMWWSAGLLETSKSGVLVRAQYFELLREQEGA